MATTIIIIVGGVCFIAGVSAVLIRFFRNVLDHASMIMFPRR